MPTEVDVAPEAVTPLIPKVKVAPVSRSVADSVAEVAVKVSAAAVSVMAIAAGVTNSGVSLTGLILTVKVAVADSVPSETLTSNFC